ncbi:MAG: prepilin-type N-terminal cleavage/methylation domain-containing protein [Candidatus Sumerlaeaceae bacterium]
MKKGFTLIELLIVVAIIAILAAIAVPNFLEAQVRSKVSRVKADMRSIATALESYFVDYNAYPYDGYYVNSPGYSTSPVNEYNYWYLPKTISTPTAYLTTCIFVDPFRQHIAPTTQAWQLNNLRYTSIYSTWSTKWQMYTGRTSDSPYLAAVLQEFGGWRLNSAGPDKTYGPYGWYGVSTYPTTALPLPYDPTNGTVSDGDILRTQLSSSGYVNAR